MKSNHLLVLSILFAVALVLQLPKILFRSETAVHLYPSTDTIVIDPGHGGEDGGAVAVTEDIESHINLAIALKLEQLLLFYGTQAVLLRETDISLHDEGLDTVKERKTSDLKNRVAMVNEIGDGLLLSIHQNFYTEPQYTGAQVFYTNDSPETGDFAAFMQGLLQEHLDPDNNRACKVVDSSLYLLNHVEMPALLIECGFLSNQEEATLLASDQYQQNIACILTAGLLQRSNSFI